MSAPDITIYNGAIATDGGSIFLEASDGSNQRIYIHLEWSIRAQQTSSTFLTVDNVRIEPCSTLEANWIEKLKTARVTGVEGVESLRKRLVENLESGIHKRLTVGDQLSGPSKLPRP